MMKTGIYFLILNKRVVYIGKTTQWPLRLACHKTIVFNEAKLFECDDDRLTEYENKLIRLFNPRHNLVCTNKRVHKRMTADWVRRNKRAIIKAAETGLRIRIIDKARRDLKYSDRYASTDLFNSMVHELERVFNCDFDWNTRKFKFF